MVPSIYVPYGQDPAVHRYEISVATGMWFGSGTTANVGLVIYGEDFYSEPIIFDDTKVNKTFFARGSVNTFTVSLPRCLGPLYKIRVWHDNSGNSPAWFLLNVVITELKSKQKWYFIANRWIAVEKETGDLDIDINASTDHEASKFKNVFYLRVSRRLGDEHLWISVFTRPPQSLFTRTQRLSCCLSLLFSTLITNAMFYNLAYDARDTFQFGPLTMSWTQVKIGIQSALIALPVNVIITNIFRNLSPKKTQPKDSTCSESIGFKLFLHRSAWNGDRNFPGNGLLPSSFHFCKTSLYHNLFKLF
ncbi:polycystin-1-like protein 3 [Montipora foliosa]|uniref:polycystin-1-like protein 3 n=1 Tax=Montipora foliosa TaxID=591990 RepID=UPI0035F20BD8